MDSNQRNKVMKQVITRPLREDKDGIEGYIAHPERAEKGPGLL